MSDPNKTWLVLLQKHEVHGLLQLPQGLAERPWPPTPADRKAAWWLSKRIANTHSQPNRSITAQGDETTALASFHSLFATTRKILATNTPCVANSACSPTSCSAAFVYALLLVNINRISPHIYYRRQLAKTYLVRPRHG